MHNQNEWRNRNIVSPFVFLITIVEKQRAIINQKQDVR